MALAYNILNHLFFPKCPDFSSYMTLPCQGIPWHQKSGVRHGESGESGDVRKTKTKSSQELGEKGSSGRDDL